VKVKLAELKMLKWLMLDQKLDFTMLFLQGMREIDVTAFLGLQLRTVHGARFSTEFPTRGCIEVYICAPREAMPMRVIQWHSSRMASLIG
jgi:hypothetical protein